MENIAYTLEPENRPSLSEWLTEFRVGTRALKRSERAVDIMSTWTQGERPVDWKRFVERKVAELNINSYL